MPAWLLVPISEKCRVKLSRREAAPEILGKRGWLRSREEDAVSLDVDDDIVLES